MKLPNNEKETDLWRQAARKYLDRARANRYRPCLMGFCSPAQLARLDTVCHYHARNGWLKNCLVRWRAVLDKWWQGKQTA